MTLLDDYLGSADSENSKEDKQSSLLDNYLPKDETKSESKKQEYWQGLSNDPTFAGIAKRIGLGTIRGAKNVADTLAHGIGEATATTAETLLPESISKPIRQSVENTKVEDKTARQEYEKEYGTSRASSVGKVIGEVGATLPMMPVRAIEGINAAAGALPTIQGGVKVAAPLINRLIGAAGTGAAGGAILGAATSGGNDESLAENVGKGAITGAIGGPVLTSAGALGKAIGGKVIGGVSSTTADLAKRAAELGIDLKGSQVSGSHFVKKFDQMSGYLPFSGQQGITDTQIGQFNRAVSRTFGDDTSEITPQVIANARSRIGQNMENIYKNSNSQVDQKFAHDLKTIADESHAIMTESESKVVMNQIKNVITKIDQNGNIPGDAYHGLTKYDAVLSKAQQSTNPNISNAANRIRNSMEDLLNRNLPSDEREALGKARGQYKAAMTVKDLVDQSAEGNVSPLKLMQKVIKSPGGKLRSGELGELADIGRKFFPTPSDSGTPLGEKVLQGIAALTHNPISAAGAGAAALMHGGLMDAGMTGAGLALNRVMRSAVNSKTVREAIIRSGTGETYGATEKVVNKLNPYSSLPVINRDERREPLRITVNHK